MMSELGEKDHKCDICGKLFGTKSHLRRHILQIHEVQTGHKCQLCNKEFGYYQHLSDHIKIEHVKCEKCGKIFSTPYSLVRHTSRKHSENERTKDYKCETCGKKFLTKEGLR